MTQPKKKTVKTIMSDEFESLDDLPLAERIDRLGQIILARAFIIMDRIRRDGKRATKKEIDIQEDLQRQFKYIQSTYNSLVKMNRINNKPDNDNFDKGLKERISKMGSSIKNIVVAVPQK